jgi:hypothetical protein
VSLRLATQTGRSLACSPKEGQEAVENILVELEIEHCHNGEAIPDSLDDFFANEEACIEHSHGGIRWLKCLVLQLRIEQQSFVGC